MKLLLIEDNPDLQAGLRDYFSPQHTVIVAADLAAGTKALQDNAPDVVVLDLSLPDGDGLSWLQEWRPLMSSRVLVLTANDEERTVLKGLALADDYVVKPVSLAVLAARLQKLVPSRQLSLGDVQLDLDRQQALRADQPLTLTAAEWRLLRYLAQHKGQLLTRDQLLRVEWDAREAYVSDNALTAAIKRLREKVEVDPGKPKLIRTIRGMGYYVED